MNILLLAVLVLFAAVRLNRRSAVVAVTLLSLSFNGFMQARTWVHPGIQHSQTDLDRVKANLAVAPWSTAYATFSMKSTASLSYSMRGPFVTVSRLPDVNRTALDSDAQAAWDQAVMWYLTGNGAYAAKAISILDAWSSTLTALQGTDAQLLAGDTGIWLCNAAEILRHCQVNGVGSGWSDPGYLAFSAMMTNIFYPQIQNIGDANWGGSCLKTMIAIAVVTENEAMFDQAVDAFRNHRDASVTKNNLPTGQNSESGRDQPHAAGGVWNLILTAEIAWKQGLDLYSEGNNRLAAATEHWCAYNLGNTVPYQAFSRSTGPTFFKDVISATGRGTTTWPGAEMSYAHYAIRKGLQMPFSLAYRDTLEANADDKLFYRLPTPAPTPPPAPTGVVATRVANRAINISWPTVSGATGYTVMRNVVGMGWGLGEVVADHIAANSFTDTNLAANTRHYYTVFAHNASARSAASSQVSATTLVDRGWTAYRAGKFSPSSSNDYAEPPFQRDGAYIPAGTSSPTRSTTYPTIDRTGLTNPAPMAVYEFFRWTASTMNYQFPGLTALGSYKVRLHFAETNGKTAGGRVFNVAVNGTEVLSNYDVFVDAGGANKAVIKEFAVTADASGQIAVLFTKLTDSAMISAIEVIDQWTDIDVGSVGLSGGGSVAGGLHTISGAGTGVGGAADSFHFKYRMLTGDGTVIARLTELQADGPAGRVGLMIRESTAAGAKFVWVYRAEDSAEVGFGSRGTNYAIATNAVGASAPALTYWFKLKRSGNLFTGYVSTDALTWTSIGSTTVEMNASVAAGFALTSGDAAVLDTATFDSAWADQLSVPTITNSTAEATIAANVPFSYQVTATDDPASYVASGLPTGLSIDMATGVISGAASVTGVFPVSIAATNSAGTSSSFTLTLTVLPGPPSITSALTVGGIAGNYLEYLITASNSAVQFAASNLPSGLSLNSMTGLISGEPSAAGTFAIGLSAQNAVGWGPVATLTLTVSPVPAAQNGATAGALSSTTTGVSTNGSNTLTWTGHGLQIDDIVQVVATAPGGFTANSNYWVVAANTANGTFQLATTRRGSPITATSTSAAVGFRKWFSWQAASSWSGGLIGGGVGATATVTFPTNTPGYQLDGNIRVGTLNVNATANVDPAFLNGRTGGKFTFVTSSGTPLIDFTGSGSARKFSFGPTSAFPLTIAGNQGLRLKAANYVSSSYQAFRFNSVPDWSQFSGGITLEQGVIEFRATAATNCLPLQRLTLQGTSASSTAVLLFSGASTTQSVGALDGSVYAYIVATSGVTGTFVVGGDNADGLFAGGVALPAYSGNGDSGRINFIKNGTGTQTISGVIADGSAANSRLTTVTVNTGTLVLSGANTYSGATTINAGTLVLSGSLTNATTVEIKSGATLHLTGTLTTGTLTIRPGGSLTGGGVINANIVNEGLIAADATSFDIAGNLTNASSGTIRLTRGAGLSLSNGTFSNSGLVDLLSAGTTNLPLVAGANVIDATALRGTLAWSPGQPAVLTMVGWVGHTYQLQRSTDLTAGGWINVGPAITGTGAPMAFTDLSPPSGDRFFYRIAVDP